MTRYQKLGQVHLWEEPVFENVGAPELRRTTEQAGVFVLTPVLPHGYSDSDAVEAQRRLLDEYLADSAIDRFVAWYYTPMALRFSEHLKPAVVVYDCMDELAAFQGAPPELLEQEKKLFERADVVFAGGASLFESKRKQHENVHLFPSSIDRKHFEAARSLREDPDDQVQIPRPRIGFFGVLDERLDRDLLKQVAEERPDWHFVLIGPVVKISEDELPRQRNIHYLGKKEYDDLPRYLAQWDVAMLPFARNAATKFISPTKTPEYLAAGRPVVSTPIRDVVKPYGEMQLVRIGADANEFVSAIEESLVEQNHGWPERVDAFLAGTSWDKTFEGMWKEIQRCTPRGPEVPQRIER